MTPTNKDFAVAGIGIPLATIISWVLNAFFKVEVPGPVEAAFGASLSALIGYVVTLRGRNESLE